MGITVHTIVGNHTAYYKDTNEVNTVELLLKEYDNVEVYAEPTTVNIGGLDILMLPWINEENKLQTLEMMDTTSADVVSIISRVCNLFSSLIQGSIKISNPPILTVVGSE